jgi:hypothetical protein
MPEDSRPDGELLTGHVSGVMPTNERSRNLRALGEIESGQRYVLSNSRCLSEGVDVPALDGVAFIDPRNSEIDIVQAVGRAIRLSKGKAIGSIVIPVFIEDHDDPDAVLNSSPFKKVWAVVNALRSHDEGLGEQLDQFRQTLGKRGTVGQSEKITFDIPTTITGDFETSLNTKLIESTTAPWEHWFGLLTSYKEEFGDCLVEARSLYGDYKLGNWVGTQRASKENLTLERIYRLDDLGFIWNQHQAQWKEGFTNLVAYKKEFGDCLVSARYQYRDYNLGNWVANLRIIKDKLTADQINDLDALGLVWDPRETQWEEGFKLLVAYKEEFGDCLVKGKFQYGGYNLGSWVSSLRTKKDKLTLERLTQLDDLGFIWDASVYVWEEAFNHLVAYKKEFGDCMVPHRTEYRGFSLANWLDRQRSQKSKLTPEQVNRFDDLGFVWDVLGYKWEEGFTHLVTYQKEFGHCLVDTKLLYHGYKLAQWVAVQRSTKNKMTSERLNRLDDLGFVWDVLEYRWKEGFKHLVAYKEEFGNCLVRQDFEHNDFRLGSWVTTLRLRKDRLTPERLNSLNDLGYIWDPREAMWEEGFNHLVAYKKEFGDCLVKFKSKYCGHNLGMWVNAQRAKKDKLTPQRFKRLDDLGFVWKTR